MVRVHGIRAISNGCVERSPTSTSTSSWYSVRYTVKYYVYRVQIQVREPTSMDVTIYRLKRLIKTAMSQSTSVVSEIFTRFLIVLACCGKIKHTEG